MVCIGSDKQGSSTSYKYNFTNGFGSGNANNMSYMDYINSNHEYTHADYIRSYSDDYGDEMDLWSLNSCEYAHYINTTWRD